MIGAIAGDVIGSVYEWHNFKRTDFPLFDTHCTFTDDTVLTVEQNVLRLSEIWNSPIQVRGEAFRFITTKFGGGGKSIFLKLSLRGALPS